LAKGPAAIVLCGGAVFFWALLTKRRQDALRLLHPVAIAAFCATALPWYVLCARRNADFLRVFLIEHNFKRYLTPEFQHIQPFWFYVPVLLAALLPWLPLILPVAFIELLAPRVSPGNPRFVTGVCIIVALLGAANFLLALFGRPLRKKGLPLRAAACVLPILAATMLAYYIAPSCFKFDPSGKTIARQLQLQNIPLGELAVGGMSRGQHYSLNFCLHQEIKDWSQENLRKEYVLTDMPRCRNLTPVPFACEPIPFNEQTTGVYLYRILMPGSLEGLGSGGGQVQKKE